MSATLALLVLAASVSATHAAAARGQQSITPVQKVINMLNDMLAKGKKEKEEEIVMFTAYQQFCTDVRKEKTNTIKKETEMIDKLTADISKAEGEILATQKAIDVHDQDLAAWSDEKNKGTADRAAAEADFKVMYNDYSASIDSVERAKKTIAAGSEVSLVEMHGAVSRLADLKLAPASAKQAMHAFLKVRQPDTDLSLLEVSAPEAKQYESHSGGVMDIVEQMGENFEEKRNEIEKEEMTKKNAFEMMMQDLTSQMRDGQRERDEKAGRAQELATQKAQAQGDLAQTKADLQADTKFLSDLNAECGQKATQYEQKQVVRAGEIKALSKAIEIMSGAAVGAGTTHLPSLVQAPSFVQLRSSDTAPTQKNAAAFLKEKSKETGSKLLSLVAQRIGADPFKKVTKMIKDMIDKLMTEAGDEAEHKGFCDTEMGSNKQTRDMKSDQVSELTAKADELTAFIKKLAEQISELSQEIAVIDAEVIKATTERNAEKEKNTATITDAKGGQKATLMALNVLRDFYNGAAESALLAQFQSGARVPGAPSTGDDSYSGMGSSSGGVIGMLEVIESDFARLDTETTAAEADAEGAYNKFMADSSKDKATKTTDMDSKTREKTSSESELLDTEKDLKTTKEELAAAMEYYDKLKPSCVEAGVSYEDRVAARKAEIESLKEALEMLR